MSPEECRWREFFPALAVSLALHAAAWQAYRSFSVEDAPVQVPRIIEVALVAPPPKAEPAPPQPPKSEPKPVKKPLPKKPAPPKPKPDIQPEPQADTPPAPPVSAPPAEKPPAPAPFVEANYRSASLNNPPTRYPRLALERHWEGQVLLRVRVLASGAAGEVRVERGSGHDALDESASEQVKSWRFVPAREGNAPVDSWVIIPVEFKLKR